MTESSLREILQRARDEAFKQCLEESGGNRTHAARKLGIHRNTLIRDLHRMRTLKLVTP